MANTKIFNPAFLLDSVAGDMEIASQVLELFLMDIPKEIDALDAAAAGLNSGDVHRIAHLIKGSAATVGAELLSRVVSEGEKLGREGKLEDVGPVLLKIKEVFTETVEAMRNQNLASDAQNTSNTSAVKQ